MTRKLIATHDVIACTPIAHHFLFEMAHLLLLMDPQLRSIGLIEDVATCYVFATHKTVPLNDLLCYYLLIL